MELPKNVVAFSQAFGSQGSLKDLLASNLKGLDPRTQNIVQYSYPGLMIGRPLNKAIIVMAGQSGTGKSTTINRFFDDDKLCETSDVKSATSEVILYPKRLQIQTVNPSIECDLTFVDIPGSLDTDVQKEALNLSKVLQFREAYESLKKHEIPLSMKSVGLKTKTVRPNLVLFIMNANDKRLVGRNSNLQKSLKILHKSNLVDLKKVNLIVVATHAWSVPKKKYKDVVTLVTSTVQKAVSEILSISNVVVVFVENMPEDHDVEKLKGSEFYPLPDGTLSHANLMNAMIELFTKNGDTLAQLCLSWYYDPDCQDRTKKVTKQIFTPSKNKEADDALKEAEKCLKSLDIDSRELKRPMIFDFSSLGYGFCPASESMKPIFVFKKTDTKQLAIKNAEFLIPNFVKVKNEAQNTYYCRSHDSKESYERQKAMEYNLDGICLSVSVASSGKWNEDEAISTQDRVVSVFYEHRLASMQIDDPSKFISKEIESKLNALPNTYANNEEAYDLFFGKFGSHFIYKQFIGGSMKSNFTVKNELYSRMSKAEMENKIKGVYKLFSAEASFNGSDEIRNLQSSGFSVSEFSISGGIPPPMVSSLAQMDKETFSKWTNSISEDPKEIMYNFVLYPYYNLEQCKYPLEMKKATIAFLSEKQQKQQVVTKKDLVKKSLAEAKKESSCFPGTTMVHISTGVSKNISELIEGDQLITCLPEDNSKSSFDKSPSTTTPFLTYSHRSVSTMAEFLVLWFSNGKVLKVTPDHLLPLLPGFSKFGKVEYKLARFFKVADRMIYFEKEKGSEGLITTPSLKRIDKEVLMGIYSPLSSAGTFFADGFLVTSYADVQSFTAAHAAFAPLRACYHLIRLIKPDKTHNQAKSVVQIRSEGKKDGIHGYAKFLMGIRKLIPFSNRLGLDSKP